MASKNRKKPPLTLYKFLKILKIEDTKLELIFDDLDSYYFKKEEIKFNQKGLQRFDSEGAPLTRILWPSRGKLKQLQRALEFKFFKKISYPNYVQGGIKQRSGVTNAKLHKGNKFKFLTDIKMFFPSIDNERVYQALTSKGFNPEVAHRITMLTTYKGMLPQGAPTSTSVANLIFHPIDIKLNAICLKSNITYSRYVDDLTFSSKRDFKNVIPELLKVVADSGFRISVKKTFYKSKIVVITGVNVGVNTFTAPEKLLEKLKDANLNPNKINGINGYIEYIKKVDKSR